jgi:hypothetical protein
VHAWCTLGECTLGTPLHAHATAFFLCPSPVNQWTAIRNTTTG